MLLSHPNIGIISSKSQFLSTPSPSRFKKQKLLGESKSNTIAEKLTRIFTEASASQIRVCKFCDPESLHLLAHQTLHSKAQNNVIKSEFFENRAINEVLYNSTSKTVAVFKDHLIYDDVCEFLT